MNVHGERGCTGPSRKLTEATTPARAVLLQLTFGLATPLLPTAEVLCMREAVGVEPASLKGPGSTTGCSTDPPWPKARLFILLLLSDGSILLHTQAERLPSAPRETRALVYRYGLLQRCLLPCSLSTCPGPIPKAMHGLCTATLSLHQRLVRQLALPGSRKMRKPSPTHSSAQRAGTLLSRAVRCSGGMGALGT